MGDLSRPVYCILGLPIDAVDLEAALCRIDAAVANGNGFLVSTPNLNFLANSRSDVEFRETLLDSDLCPADGAPIVWIARLVGVPIRSRVAGSDIFDALKASNRCARRLSVFLFGGEAGAAETAARALNSGPAGLHCVGTLDPGFGSIKEMSGDEIIDTVNASEADILAVALGAKKGQLWLHRNHDRLKIPVRAHFGAVINFQAGSIRRAPRALRAWGLEWAWRIKEEPHLWRRYWNDGMALLRVLVTRVAPLVMIQQLHRLTPKRQPSDLLTETLKCDDCVTVRLFGDATEQHIAKAVDSFQDVVINRNRIVVTDFSGVRYVDARFLGLLLMFRKQLKRKRTGFRIVGASPSIRRIFYFNELGFLLSPN